jgi:uncharacterized membrane protein YdjX (TVP38/TMEM64 family)
MAGSSTAMSVEGCPSRAASVAGAPQSTCGGALRYTAAIMADETKLRPGLASAAWQMARRYAVLVLLIAGAVAVALSHPEVYLSYDSLAEHRAAWSAWIAEHFPAALALFFGLYVVAKICFVPGGPLFVAAAGLLLGTLPTTAVATLGGTVAGVLVFEVAHRSIGRGLREKALPFVDRFAAAFRTHGLSYLLMLRLVPIVPFWLASLVPALTGMRRRTYILGTFLGNIPTNFLYASLGGALGAMLDQGRAFDARTLAQPRVLLPLIGLAALSAAPILYAKLSGREAMRMV